MRWAGAIVAILAATGCAVTDSLEDCEKDADCATLQRCHPTGKFCERDLTTLEIPALVSRTGDSVGLSAPAAEGYEVAVAELNSVGGLLGRKVGLRIHDDQSDLNVARALTQRIVGSSRVSVMLGPSGSTIASAVIDVTYAHRFLQISPTAGAASLGPAQPPRDRYFFRPASTNSTSAALSSWAHDAGKCRRLAILHAETAGGAAYRDAMTDIFSRLGGCIAGTAIIPNEKQLSYDQELSALAELDAQCAIVIAKTPAMGALIATARTKPRFADDERVSRILWLTSSDAENDVFLQEGKRAATTAVPHPLDGVVVPRAASDRPEARAYHDVRAKHATALGLEGDPPAVSFFGYDALVLAALSIEKAGTPRDGRAIRDGFWEIVDTGEDHRVYGPDELGDALAAIRRGAPIHYSGAANAMRFNDLGSTLSEPYDLLVVEQSEFSKRTHFDDDAIAKVTSLPTKEGSACPAR